MRMYNGGSGKVYQGNNILLRPESRVPVKEVGVGWEVLQVEGKACVKWYQKTHSKPEEELNDN